MSTLDKRAAPTVTPEARRPSKRAKAGWITAGVGVLALAGVSALWLGYDDEVAPRLAAVAAATPRAPGAAAVAAAGSTSAAGAPGNRQDSGPAGAAANAAAGQATPAVAADAGPSTAAQLRDTAPAEAGAPEKMPSLHEMLAASATSTAKTTAKTDVKPRDELSRALERPANANPDNGRQHTAPASAGHGELAQHGTPSKSGHPAQPSHAGQAHNVRPADKEPLKMAQNVAPQRKESAREAARDATRLAAKSGSKPATQKAKAPAADSDVTLLAALMAHVQAKPAPGTKPSTPAEQLKQCRQMNDAGAEQCRARLCAGSAKKEPECKVTPLAKTSSDT